MRITDMKEIVLVRHGDVEYPADETGRKLLYGPDAHLSDVGKNQMQVLAEELSDKPLDFVYTSPLPRAQQSAAIITAEQEKRFGRKLHAIVINDLREPELGEWVGVPIDELERNPNGFELYAHPKPGQEPYSQVSQRVTFRIRQLVQELNPDSKSLIVAHGEIVKISNYALEHPTAEPPKSSSVLPLSDQLKNGEAFLTAFDKENRVIKKERITPKLV